jgi:hypothetical protein
MRELVGVEELVCEGVEHEGEGVSVQSGLQLELIRFYENSLSHMMGGGCEWAR